MPLNWQHWTQCGKDALNPKCNICPQYVVYFYFKINSWVEPSFGELLSGVGVNKTLRKGTLSGETKSTKWASTGNQTGIKSRKRKGDLHETNNQINVPVQDYISDQDEPWVDIHAPQSQVLK